MIDVPGDPAAMRSVASMLRMRAETLAEVAARIDSQTTALAFEGPAAEEFRAAMVTRRQTAEGVVNQLLSLSDYVLRAAAEVEQQQLMAGGSQ